MFFVLIVFLLVTLAIYIALILVPAFVLIEITGKFDWKEIVRFYKLILELDE